MESIHAVLPYQSQNKNFAISIKSTKLNGVVFAQRDFERDTEVALPFNLAAIILRRVKFCNSVVDNLGFPERAFIKVDQEFLFAYEDEYMNDMCERLIDLGAGAEHSRYEYENIINGLCKDSGKITDTNALAFISELAQGELLCELH